MMQDPAGFSRIERLLLSVALVFIIVIAVKMISFIVTLFMMSLILTLLMLPTMNWLRKKGLSDFAAVLAITCAAIVIVLAFIFLTMLSFNTLMADIPRYQQELNTRIQDINALLGTYGISLQTDGSPLLDIGDLMSLGLSSLVSVVDTVEFVFFVGVTTFFLLLDAPRISALIEQRFGKDSETMRQMNMMTGYVIDFIVVRTETNFIHGLLFGGFLGLIGVHGAILWGVLTFLLGYIPFFGLVIAAIPAIFFAWLQFGLPGALAVIAAVCVLNLIVENPIYSFLCARKFEMPALVVILSVIFWGWLLGLVGMLFAIPFTLLLLLLFEFLEELRWINLSLGVSHLFEEKSCGKKPGP
jgi:predicted PurR-regulated permease PerM